MNILTQVVSIGGNAQTTVTDLASTLGTEPDLVRTTPLTLIGSVPEVIDKLAATREQLGISYVVVFDTAIDQMAPVVAQLAGT